jgi:4-amino-4-deoxy-L-arabinose transferase-like glycosyltransferase
LSLPRHLAIIALLLVAAGLLLASLARRTEIMFADGLRYIAQAREIERGSWQDGLARAVDHPAYPSAVASVHRLAGGDRPEDWQSAAQIASVVSAVLLVIPLYLLALEIHGASSAWLACLLTFLIPHTGHVLADVLSEGTFLLFWAWGCWSAVRFLKEGRTAWLIPTIAFTGLSYLARPEGLLLPVALVSTLGITALVPTIRLDRARWLRAVGVLAIGPALVVGPYVAYKGGIGTKPAVARLLGTAGRSGAMAVERDRPLDPDQTPLQTYSRATRAAAQAVAGAVSLPFLLLAAGGLFFSLREVDRRREQLFLTIIVCVWLLALVRLHATGGYCTPRHAMIAALPLFAAAARGLRGLADSVAARWTRFGNGAPVGRRGTALLTVCLAACVCYWAPETLAPLNPAFGAYRQAGEWLGANTPSDARILDLKGWATFYGERTGYSFGELNRAAHDPDLGWVVAHDALLIGPWDYCEVIRKAVAGRSPVRSFPERRRAGVAQVHVFDLSTDVPRSASLRRPSPLR